MITNSDDIIDSRDVIERIEELEGQDQRDESEEDELEALKFLAEQCEGYVSDWRHGETLIRRSHFVDYCEELCKDIGDLPKEIPHYIEIDWQKTADNLEADYTEVDFDGVAYLVRCS